MLIFQILILFLSVFYASFSSAMVMEDPKDLPTSAFFLSKPSSFSEHTDYTYIDSSKALETFCRALQREPFIAIDTEFDRSSTFYPYLCLIQVASPTTGITLIDPLQDSIDLTPFYMILTDPNILKIFHAGHADAEIFLHEYGSLPTPVFDTQIAAQFCGLGNSIGYKDLVQHFYGVHIDKSDCGEAQ